MSEKRDRERALDEFFSALDPHATSESGRLSDGFGSRIIKTTSAPDIKALFQRLAVELQPHGELVFDSIPPNADRLCIFLANQHGGQDEKWIRLLLLNPIYRQVWLKHQQQLQRSHEVIADAAGPKNIRLIMESLPADQKGMERILDSHRETPVAELEQMIQRVDADPRTADFYFRLALRQIGESEAKAQGTLQAVGNDRFLIPHLISIPGAAEKIHGLDSPERYPKNGTEAEKAQANFDALNEALRLQVRKIQPGETALVSIGGLHSGYTRSSNPLGVQERSHVENVMKEDAGISDKTGIVTVKIRGSDQLWEMDGTLAFP